MNQNMNLPTGAGKSSFKLIDIKKFFKKLNLQKEIVFLDIACGKGAYCLAASSIIGPKGTVYGIDLWPEGIEHLKTAAVRRGINNIIAVVGDAGRQLPIEDHAVDVCLMATVLHDFVDDQIAEGVLNELNRVLKPAATLAVMEFKKIEGPPGPPINIRLSPEDVADMLSQYGIRKECLEDVGPYNYLMLFKRS